MSSTITEDVKTLFPHLSSPANLTSPQSNSDIHLSKDEISSEVLVPSESKSLGLRKLPSHLQDYHCYNTSSSTDNTHITTPYPITKYVSYTSTSEPFRAFLNIITKTPLPQNFKEAKKDKVWCDSMNLEIDAFEQTKTWTITELPPGKEALGCRWIHTIKYHADGTEERKKSRLVAKGYTQQEGIDFLDTFSPVAKMATVKILLSFAPKLKWNSTQLDISNALLSGDLDEEIYMKLPPGYSELRGVEVPPNAVCRFHKSVYGLKQASSQWFVKFSITLLDFGFETGTGDHTLFVKIVDGKFLVFLVYVDDILIASDAMVDELKQRLSSAFKLRDLGTPKYFLGLEIARSTEDISVCQRKYVLDLLESTGFSGCRPSSIPMEPNQKMSKEDGILLEDAKHYRRLLGRLQYLTFTRPDIGFTVSKLAQYSLAPTDVHIQAVHKVLRYLKGTVGLGLFYILEINFDIRGYSDSDWSGCPDSRRSVTGYAMFVVTLLCHGLEEARQCLM